jgi:hypothetical protein
MSRLISFSAGLVLIAFFAGCQTKSAPPAPPGTPPDFTVKAGAVLAEYGANAVAVDAKYKGKLVRVTGKFGSAQKAPFMGYAVQLLPEDAPDVNLSGIECFIVESAQAEVAKFQPAQMVTLQGTCDGQVLGQVKMSKCTIVQ